MKSTLNFHARLILIAFMLFGFNQLSAQILVNAPEAADNPNLSGNDAWTAICAGVGGFNQYYVNISWAGTANSSKEFDAEFAIPTDTRGDGFKMRVRSTDPAYTSSASTAYAMYYMDVTNNINISDDGSGVPPGMVCSTGPITLQVDNVANPDTYQYIWYMSGSPITGETGHTLTVSTSGMYYAIIDYGNACSGSANTDSNIVDVTIGSGGEGIFINPPSKNILCAGETETLSINTTDPSWNYIWFKDGVQIAGATSSTYTVDANNADFAGDYQIEISSSSICNERSAAITFSNADDFTVTRRESSIITNTNEKFECYHLCHIPNVQMVQEWYRNNW